MSVFVPFEKIEQFLNVCLGIKIIIEENNVQILKLENINGTFRFSTNKGQKNLDDILINRNIYIKNQTELNSIVSDYNDLLNQIYSLDKVDDKTLYKYISDKSPALPIYLSKSVSFAKPTELNDVKDCDCQFTVDDICYEGREAVRILSCCNRNNIPMMWGVYANSSKGLCFEYKLKNILSKTERIPLIVFGQVDYGPKCKTSKFVKDNGHSWKDDLLNLFKKDISWEHEEEYRIVLFDNHFDTDCLYVPVKVECSNFHFMFCDEVQSLKKNKLNVSYGLRYMLSKLIYFNIDANENRWKIVEKRSIPSDLHEIFIRLIQIRFLGLKNSDKALVKICNDEIQEKNSVLLELYFSNKLKIKRNI